MAGDWIKMRCELQTHPKIVRILSATRSDKFRVIGGLHSVWSVFDAHSVDGVLFGYTPETLDHVIGWDGFAAAMIAVGWLAFDGAETLSLPEFGEHNGQSAKRRAEDQKRKRNDRKSGSSPKSVRNLSAIEPDKLDEEIGLEKRREESIHTPSASAQIAMILRKHSINATPFHPSVVALAEQEINLDTLEACCAEARKAKPNESLSVAYIVKKLEGWKAQAATVDVRGAQQKPKAISSWTLTLESMRAKARELKISDARPGESVDQFKARIIDAINAQEAA